MKKKLTTIALIIICLALVSGGTLAYYTHTDTARNVITSGGIKVQIVEQQLVNGKPESYPDDEAIMIMPGTSVSKIVSVQSLEQPAWLRMSYTLTVKDANKNTMELSAEQLAAIISINTDSTSWTLKDGWYYYNAPLGGGEISKPLFTTVSFSGPNMGNEYQKATLYIDVKAEAIQQANNGSTAAEAYWPTT